MSKATPVPEFSLDGRKVILLTYAEGKSVCEFLTNARLLMVGESEDLHRAHRVLGRQLEAIDAAMLKVLAK